MQVVREDIAIGPSENIQMLGALHHADFDVAFGNVAPAEERIGLAPEKFGRMPLEEQDARLQGLWAIVPGAHDSHHHRIGVLRLGGTINTSAGSTTEILRDKTKRPIAQMRP